jgi:hypothetical protein
LSSRDSASLSAQSRGRTGSSRLRAFSRVLQEVTGRTARQQAQQTIFANLAIPSRWFTLPETQDRNHESRIVCAVDSDPSAEYWRILEQSLNRQAALEFIRAGGRIQPETFDLSTANLTEVEEEACASRQALQHEIEKLRDMYRGNGDLLVKAPELKPAYRAIAAEQPALLELRHAWVATQTLLANLKLLDLANAPIAKAAAEKRLLTLSKEIIERLDSIGDAARNSAFVAGSTIASWRSPRNLRFSAGYRHREDYTFEGRRGCRTPTWRNVSRVHKQLQRTAG